MKLYKMIELFYYFNNEITLSFWYPANNKLITLWYKHTIIFFNRFIQFLILNNHFYYIKYVVLITIQLFAISRNICNFHPKLIMNDEDNFFKFLADRILLVFFLYFIVAISANKIHVISMIYVMSNSLPFGIFTKS